MVETLMFDTSVWIDFFNGIDNDNVLLLSKYLENDYPIIIGPTIIQELLQGIRDDGQYKKIKEILLSFRIIEIDPVKAAIGAAKLYRKLRKEGVTIKKSNDCLIAYYAIASNINIIHNDRDFVLIFENI